jgi:uncharacterized protein (TIGR03382 family)
MHRLFGLVFCAALAATPRIADANSCNLWTYQTVGELRVGCPLMVFSPPGVSAELPEVRRGGVAINPTITQDQVSLKVTYEHYASPDSCYLEPPSYEQETFDRYVLTWEDLKAGEYIELDGISMVVPGPGECGPFMPLFYCQDPIQGCGDYLEVPDDEQAGCSAGTGSTSWLAFLPLLGLVLKRKRK